MKKNTELQKEAIENKLKNQVKTIQEIDQKIIKLTESRQLMFESYERTKKSLENFGKKKQESQETEEEINYQKTEKSTSPLVRSFNS